LKQQQSPSYKIVHREPEVMVFGGAIVDQIATPLDRHTRLIRGSSNPGTLTTSYGGVGRNISEALGRAGAAVALVSAVGDDAAGKGLLRHTAEAIVDVSRVRVILNNHNHQNQNDGTSDGSSTKETQRVVPHERDSAAGNRGMVVADKADTASASSQTPSTATATYTAVHDCDGELVVAVADVAVLSSLDRAAVESLSGAVRRSRLIVSDGNLSAEAFTTLLRLSTTYGVPVFFEPTSDYKCILPISTRTIGQVLSIATTWYMYLCMDD
jgi:sugar/nucleoside kinase (ribokinase family)